MSTLLCLNLSIILNILPSAQTLDLLLLQMSVRGGRALKWLLVAQPPESTVAPRAAATAPCFSLVLNLVHLEFPRLMGITVISMRYMALIISQE
jgi:hypothetical protein